VPCVSGKAWKAYPKDIQDLIVTVWKEKIGAIRDNAEARQKSAREDAIKNGIKATVPSKEDIDASRKRLMAKQDEIVKELKIDPDFVKLITATLAGS
jgi:TRAP-type C4-dicarboxylate transport system substrate-binding protein